MLKKLTVWTRDLETEDNDPGFHEAPNQELETAQTESNIEEIEITSNNAVELPNSSIPNQEENNNRAKLPLTLQSLEGQESIQTTPDSQLVLNRLQTEFPMLINSLEGDNTRGTNYGVHTELGVELSEGDITGATPKGEQARAKSHMPIIISYNSPTD